MSVGLVVVPYGLGIMRFDEKGHTLFDVLSILKQKKSYQKTMQKEIKTVTSSFFFLPLSPEISMFMKVMFNHTCNQRTSFFF